MLVNRSNPVIVQVRDAIEAVAGLRWPQGVIQFTSVPNDGDIVAISDGETTWQYELVGTSSIEESRDELLKDIQANSPPPAVDPRRGIIAREDGESTIFLYNTCPGALGNVPIVYTPIATEESVLVAGMSGGADMNLSPPGPSLPGLTVASGADAYQTAWEHPDDGVTYTRMAFTMGGPADTEALVSFDGGATEHMRVGGGDYGDLAHLPITGDIKVKNAATGSNHGRFTVVRVG